jgi:hypothetical protein
MDFLQGASNAAASNVSGPVDLLAFALRKMGFPVPEDPVLGAKWMADRGITAQPQNRVAGMLGETAGLVAPIAAAARAPEIAANLLKHGEQFQRYNQALGPAGASHIFSGPTSKTWDKAAAAKAEQMLADGADPRAVWRETGTFRSPDGMLRQEIDDSTSGIQLGYVDAPRMDSALLKKYASENKQQRVGDVLRHPDLQASYPDLPYIHTVPGNVETRGTLASYDPQANFGAGRISLGDVAGWQARSPMLHELQHAVQQREGFAKGGNPELFNQAKDAELARDALWWARELRETRKSMPQADTIAVENKLIQQYQELGALDMLPSRDARDLARQPSVMFADKFPGDSTVKDLEEIVRVYGLDKAVTPRSPQHMYRLLAGEAEARAVQKRMDLTPQFRRSLFPLDSYDAPVDQLIVHNGQSMGTLSGLGKK